MATATKKRATKKAAKTVAKKAPGETRGRHGQFTGKKIYKLANKNPRREGTSGFNSWNAISKNGMAYEDYLAAGGKPRDLLWDISRGWAELRGA
jgi:hypothetical protein